MCSEFFLIMFDTASFSNPLECEQRENGLLLYLLLHKKSKKNEKCCLMQKVGKP